MNDGDPKDAEGMIRRIGDVVDELLGNSKKHAPEYDPTGGEGMSYHEGSEDLWSQDDKD